MEVFIVEDIDPSSPKMGGVAGYTRKLLEYLSKTSIRVSLLGTGHNNNSMNNDKSTFIPVTYKTKLTGYEYLLRLIAKTLFFRIRASAIIHAQHPEYMLPFVLFHRKNPKIVAIRGPVLKEVRLKRKKIVSLIYQLVEPFILRRSDIILTVDEATREFYQIQYPWLEKIRVIPTGVDLNKFRLLDRNGLRRKCGFKPNDKVIAYVGRLEKEKNVDFLINCFAQLLKSVSKAILVLIGDGRDREHLEQLTSSLGLKRVIFMGAQEPDKIPEIMNCADVLALCSVYEGSPTVVKEALACGLPVVSTDVGDVSKIIRHTPIGKIVRRNQEDFVYALTDLLLISDREKVRRECTEAAAEFGFDQIGTKTVELYKELVERET